MVYLFLNGPPILGGLPQSHLVPLKAKPGDPVHDKRFKYVLTYIGRAAAALRADLENRRKHWIEILSASSGRAWLALAFAGLISLLFVSVSSFSGALPCVTRNPRLVCFASLVVLAGAAWLPLCRLLSSDLPGRSQLQPVHPAASGQEADLSTEYTFEIDVPKDARLEGPSANLSFYCAMAVAAGELTGPRFVWQRQLAQINLAAAANVNFDTGAFMSLSQGPGQDFEAKIRALCEYQRNALKPGAVLAPVQLAVFSFTDSDAVRQNWPTYYQGEEPQAVKLKPGWAEYSVRRGGGLRFLFCRDLESFKDRLSPGCGIWIALRILVIPLLILTLMVREPEPPRFRIECLPVPCFQSGQICEATTTPGSIVHVSILLDSSGSPGPVAVTVASNHGQTLSGRTSEERRLLTSQLTLDGAGRQASFLYTMPETQPPPVVVVTVKVRNRCGMEETRDIVFSSD